MRLVLVCGGQRSGTTLLQSLLCQAQGVQPMVREAKYLRHLVAAYAHARRRFTAETEDYFADVAELATVHRAALAPVLGHLERRFAPAAALVLKSPELARFARELPEVVPQARVLVMVRDPRDVVASLLEVGRRLAAAGVRGPLARAAARGDIAWLCAHVNDYYAAWLDGGAAPPAEVVRYEALVTAPRATLDALAATTGLALGPVDPALPAPIGSYAAQRADAYSAAWVSDLYGAAVSERAIGRFRGVLDTAAQRAVARGCAALCRRFGYATG